MKNSRWWEEDKGNVSGSVFNYVEEVERNQSDIFDRFVKLASLYDPNDHAAGGIGWFHTGSGPWSGSDSFVSENLIASNVDTAFAEIAAVEVRARFMTDDADWSEQRLARHLEWYSDALCKTHCVDELARDAFKDGCIKGTGMVKVSIDWQQKKPVVERVMVDDIVVDEGEVRAGNPLQMHERIIVNKDVLKARYPEHAEEIDNATVSRLSRGGRDYWADYRPLERDDLVAIESFRKAIGKPGSDYYVPGRHTVCIEGYDILDEEYKDDFFPYAVFRWSKRLRGWYGLGLAERISGHQRRKNKLSWQIDRQQDQLAVPTTYVGMQDKNLAVTSVSRVGSIVPIKGNPPVTVIPPAVSAEVYRRDEQITERAYEETGIARMAATSRKPPGLDSGVALREYRDQRSGRFSQQEKSFQQLKLDIVLLLIGACKKLGSDAPTMLRRTRFGVKKIAWDEVDPGEMKIKIEASSPVAKTPAGRLQLALEWAQAGVISQDEARRLMQHPDTEHSLSLYTAALENIEQTMDEILDGTQGVVPEPYQNLKMGVWRMQQAYLKAVADGAPEEILDAVQVWIVQASYMLSMAEQPMLPQEAVAAPAPGEVPAALNDIAMAPAQAPMGPAPQSALAPEAMNLVAK